MDNKRLVKKQLRIFDLMNYRSKDFPDIKSVRIMHEYDETDKKQAFTVLNENIPADSAEQIILWLKENMEDEELIYGLDYNEIDFMNAEKAINHRLN